jgi:hypothetical protein
MHEAELPSLAAVFCGYCEMLGAAMLGAARPLLETCAMSQPGRNPVATDTNRPAIHRLRANVASLALFSSRLSEWLRDRKRMLRARRCQLT